jgi:energy-coupling factor transporter ATP-binding protein EcfA2
MIKTIKFKNYKLFKQEQTLELRPITVLIGKNSSGKSAVLKLTTLIENALSGSFSEPLRMNNNGVELGGGFRDLIYGRKYGQIGITMENDTEKLEVVIGSNVQTRDSPEIFFWKLNDIEVDTGKETFNGFLCKSKNIKTLALKTDYISSFRDGLSRYFDKPPKVDYKVGIKGENVYSILIEDALTTPQKGLKRVSDFYKDNFEGWGIRVNQDNAPPYQIELIKNDLKINLKDVGLGMIHALPLVVRAFLAAKEDTLIVIEEPELHLHPAAHGNLAELFSKRLNDKRRYLIETHSQNFVLRLRALVAEGKLKKEDLAIYYVDFDEDENESNLELIEVDDLGEVEYWPENIFNESLHESIRIRKAQKARIK